MSPSTTCRDIAARTAFTGGLLALGLAVAMLKWQAGGAERNIDIGVFFVTWATVCLATGLAAAWQLRQAGLAASATVKHAVVALTPGLFAGAAIGACLTLTSGLPLFPAVFWIVFYGLSLLSLRPWAPPAVLTLGWAFLLTGVGAFIYLMYQTVEPEFDLPFPINYYPAALLGVTFGGYHLLYAAYAFTAAAGRSDRRSDAGSTS